jgi:hypothetical protein
VLITAFSDVPVHLPGIALDSTPLFLVERGGAVVAALIVVTGLVGRTLKQELPTGFSPATGSVTYAEEVKEAASSSDEAATALKARLDEQDADLSGHKAYTEKLAEVLEDAIADIEGLKKPPNQPGT